MIPKLLRISAWILFVAIVIATLGPLSTRPDTGMPLFLERFLALAAIGFAFHIAYPGHAIRTLVLLIVALAGLELAQHLTPDRHGTLLGFVEKTAGAGAGIVAARLFARS
jgi:hypothetical protein